MKKKIRAKSFKEGDIVKVPINSVEHTYMRIIVDRLCAFYDCKTSADINDLKSLITLPIIFTLVVYDQDLKEGDWLKIGNLPLSDDLKIKPAFFIKDILPKGTIPQTYRIYENGIDRPAKWAECKDLDAEGVYNSTHVKARLNDFYYGDPDRMLKEYLASR